MIRKFLCYPSEYEVLLNILQRDYGVLYEDAIKILNTKNVDDIVASYNFSYDDLIHNGFYSKQINQILKAKELGLNLAFMPIDTTAEEFRNIISKFSKDQN